MRASLKITTAANPKIFGLAAVVIKSRAHLSLLQSLRFASFAPTIGPLFFSHTRWLKLAAQFLLESVTEESQTVGSLILLAKTEQRKLQYLDFENFSKEDAITIQHVPDFLANNLEEISWILSGLSSADLNELEIKT